MTNKILYDIIYMKLKKEGNQMKHYHCPVNAWDCPYYKDEPNHPCVCTIEGDPFYECDDFAGMWNDDDEYWDDHE